MDPSVVVPLPSSVADNMAAAFLPLVGQSPLTRMVRAMLGAVAEPGRIVIAAAESLVDDVYGALASSDLASVNIVSVGGAATRADCIDAALKYVRRASSATSNVLVHDISSPLASADVMERVVAGLRDGGTVVMPKLAVTDSIKAVDARGSVTATLDRSVLSAVQYPRGFSIDALAGLLIRRESDDFDELAVAVGGTEPITFVDGDPDAFRAELPRDAEFIEAIIASRPTAPGGV